METAKKKDLATYRGWLLVFIIVHLPLALYYFTSGVYALAGFVKAGGSWALAIFNLLLCLLLPASLLLLLWKRAAFRFVYVAYSAIMIANYLVGAFLAEGTISALNIILAIVLSLPWVLYLFLSKRVEAVLALGREERAHAKAPCTEQALPEGGAADSAEDTQTVPEPDAGADDGKNRP